MQKWFDFNDFCFDMKLTTCSIVCEIILQEYRWVQVWFKVQGLYVCLMLVKPYFSHLICRLSQKNTGQNKNNVFTQQAVKVKIFSANLTQQSHYKRLNTADPLVQRSVLYIYDYTIKSLNQVTSLLAQSWQVK